MDEKVKKELIEALKQAYREKQSLPNQYVIAYYKKGDDPVVSDDTLLGYHASTFNQLTDNILEAKRYQGDEPYGQIQTIHDNLKFLLEHEFTVEEPLGELMMKIRSDHFEGLTLDDIYMEPQYLADGTEPNDMNFKII